jgi:methyltransferase (TIGR00027 family)
VAERRAAHQLLDKPLVFDDPLALRIIDPEADLLERSPLDRFLRAAFAARSRLAEDALGEAYARGVRQYVVLGAGFDTFAYRNPFDGLRVLEVDHPATQAAKRARLAERGIGVPADVVFVPVDFATTSLADALDIREATFFSWLGVVPYLEREAIEATLRYVASLPAGSTIVFDYGSPPSSLSLVGRIVFDRMSKRVAAAGEPWKSFFAPEELETMLRACGFSQVESFGPAEINRRYFVGRADGLRIGEMLQMAKARTG